MLYLGPALRHVELPFDGVVCRVHACDRTVDGDDYCHTHYERRRCGRPLGGRILTTRWDFFWAKVVVEPTFGCWMWTGATDGGSRYGAFYDGKVVARAHRWSYERKYGPIPEGLVTDHRCRRTRCVNPDHLDIVTQAENIMRGLSLQAENARKTHCIRGHEFTAENTYEHPPPRSGRACRTCRSAYMKRWYREHRAEQQDAA